MAEQIESLENRLAVLLQELDPIEKRPGIPKAAITAKAATKRRITLPKKVESAAPNDSGDGRGTLRPAVVAVLKESDRPLKTADIYDALIAQKYKFTFKEAKKVLGIRLYKMLGVQSLGDGLFKAK